MMKRLLIHGISIRRTCRFRTKKCFRQRKRDSTENSLNRGAKGLSESSKRKKFSITDSIINPPDQISIFN